MKPDDEELSFPCTECPAGHLSRQYITYFTWLGDELITVPDFPAWICDVCGRREYDLQALNQLTLLLNPNAGKPANKARSISTRTSAKSTRPTHPE